MKFKSFYLSEVFREINKISDKTIDFAIDLILKTIKKNKIYICGNGGSYALANHALCDLVKCVYQDTNIKIKLNSLSSNPELLSAISNDISYDKIFSYQLNIDCSKDDLLIVISTSGNSKNIINAIKIAKKFKMKVISFTGFDGGKTKKYSDINFNINTENYGISEDCHSILLHIISQKIRIKYGNPSIL